MNNKNGINILKKADEIINQRSEEKERQYGPMDETMQRAADIFNLITETDTRMQPEDMYYAMVAMKLARQAHCHKEDNLLDAVAYLGALNNMKNEK